MVIIATPLAFDMQTTTDLFDLLKSQDLSHDFDGFTELVLKQVSEEIQADALSFWIHSADNDSFKCVKSFEPLINRFRSGMQIGHEQFPKYYTLQKTSYILEVEDCGQDSVFEGKLASPITENHSSWLSIQSEIGGKVAGFIRLERSDNHQWTLDEQRTIKLALLVLNQSLLANNLVPNQQLPEKLSDKMEDFKFFTAHNLRHPHANLIALIEMLEDLGDNAKNRRDILNLLKTEAIKLDHVIRLMVAKLDKE